MSSNTKRSLKGQGSQLADNFYQLKILNDSVKAGKFTGFREKLAEHGLGTLKPTGVDILQVNVGYMCNQVCKHCHVDAGPDRREIMTRETMEHCLEVLRRTHIPTVDLTGGAPEMNPDFRWFVEEIRKTGSKVLVRCNLTIIRANKKYYDLPEFFRDHQIEVVSSLPYYNRRRTDSQRGDGVFDDSIEALKMLNEVGYGQPGTGLILNLVYNPTGAFLPAPQASMEAEFKRNLKEDFGIEFNSLYNITNIPISRFLDYLIASKNYEAYMTKLVNGFNPVAAQGVMCRNTISVGYDGYMYDCDFNQMLGIKVKTAQTHIKDFDLESLTRRDIMLDQHCFGCTAGAGSSCGGEIA
ncbi:MAG: arsenosugar biosynthesis radical SAM protein ArsS [Bacteroidia bacterium]|nr:arsenosugar biosynthesis radical SAM protein ArsS [Bacteroidia bacterium]